MITKVKFIIILINTLYNRFKQRKCGTIIKIYDEENITHP